MCKYPVVNLTLKSAKQPVFASAYNKLKNAVIEEFQNHRSVLESDKLTAEAVRKFQQIISGEEGYDDYS